MRFLVHEREGYTVSLQTGNDENDFAAAQDAALEVHSDEAVLTGSIMTDVDGERSRSDDQTLNALLEEDPFPFFFDGRGIGKGTQTKLEKFLTSFLTRGDWLAIETNIATFDMSLTWLYFLLTRSLLS